jgi:REP element-mobilizing transposase RayT
MHALPRNDFHGHDFANLLYHIVFTTKGRLPLIRDDLKDPLYSYIGGILRGERGILLEIGGMPDHVHLLVKLKTDISVAVMVQKIKGKSSKWINERQDHPDGFEWQAGYGIFSAPLRREIPVGLRVCLRPFWAFDRWGGATWG